MCGFTMLYRFMHIMHIMHIMHTVLSAEFYVADNCEPNCDSALSS